MTGEDRIRDAFRDLNDRVARDVDPATSPGDRAGTRPSRPSLRSGLLSRPGLAIAGLAVVAGAGAVAIGLAGGGDDQQVATDSSTSTTEVDDVTASTTDGDGDGADQGSTSEPASDDPGDPDGGPGDGDRFRVATELVAADAADPFLNVRADPDPRADLVAKLPAHYTGLRATGRAETAEDGGRWFEVELLHPVAVAELAIGDDRRPTGWVNRAFVQDLTDGLAVGTDELPACDPGGDGSGVGGGLGSGHVAAIESAALGADCVRVVLIFGTGQAPIGWIDLADDTGPATAVPSTVTRSSGGFGTTIDLGPVTSTWSEATETVDGFYLARDDDGTIDLVSPAPADVVSMQAVPEIGAIAVDFRVTGAAPPSGAGVVLTRPLAPASGSIDAVGLSRPFEAVLGVRVEDGTGRPVEAVFSGSAQLGTRRTTEYGVGTNDWVEAWGRFAFRVEGLATGRYTLVLNAQDAADEPETLRLPFTIDDGVDGGPTIPADVDQAVAIDLIGFARGGDVDDLALADQVTLLLGSSLTRTSTPAQLADRSAWVFDPADGFAGFVGPFSALDVLDGGGLRFTAGAAPNCAGPPLRWPGELDGLRQVNIEPVGIDSCLDWFGVHLFLDDDDEIAAVALALFGP